MPLFNLKIVGVFVADILFRSQSCIIIFNFPFRILLRLRSTYNKISSSPYIFINISDSSGDRNLKQVIRY